MKNTHTLTPIKNRIQIKNRTFLQWLTLIVAFWTVLFKPVSGLPGPISYIKYTPDGILIIMLALCLVRKKVIIKRELQSIVRIVIVFFLYCLLSYLPQYQSVAYFLWGFRNIFRFYIAFFLFCTYLNQADTNTWFKVMDFLFWINAGLSLLQFFFLGISGDYLGGIFGIQGASNGFTLCFMSIVVSKSLLEAFNGNESFSLSIVKCVVSILVAAMAEMKFYYFVLLFLLVGTAGITRFSGRKVFFLILSLVAVMFGAVLLVEWFGFGGFLSFEGLWEAAVKENYSSVGDINRLSAIPSLCRRIVTNPVQQFLGLGLGNCDTSSFAICNTPFYQNYGYLHYTWFTSAILFLETGFIGLGIYTSVFIACFFQAYSRTKTKTGNLMHNQLAILISILCVILIFYNSSLRIESGYMMYFVLALPFIRQDSEKQDEQTLNSATKGGMSI